MLNSTTKMISWRWTLSLEHIKTPPSPRQLLTLLRWVRRLKSRFWLTKGKTRGILFLHIFQQLQSLRDQSNPLSWWPIGHSEQELTMFPTFLSEICFNNLCFLLLCMYFLLNYKWRVSFYYNLLHKLVTHVSDKNSSSIAINKFTSSCQFLHISSPYREQSGAP